MTGDRIGPSAGPQRTAEELAARLFCVSGCLAKYRQTGGELSAFEVKLLVTQLDAAAAEAERMGREIGELVDMIIDLAEEDDAPPSTPAQIARLRAPLTVIAGGRGA